MASLEIIFQKRVHLKIAEDTKKQRKSLLVKLLAYLCEIMYVTDGMVGRTTSAPISALCLIVDKVQGFRSGILS